MQIITKWFSRITTFITVAIIVFITILMGPNLLGYKSYIVLSGSMEPVINTGSIAYINTKDTDVEVNDIITYRLEGTDKETLVTHRLIEKVSDDTYVTKGDANEVADLVQVNRSQIVGTYKYQIPKIGYLVSKMNKKVMIVTIAWIMLLNMMSIGMNIFITDDTQKDNEDDNKKNEKQDGEFNSKP